MTESIDIKMNDRMSGYLLDTWALVEFYEGTEIGERIYSLIEGEESVFTPIVSIAELSDNYHNGNFKTDHNWKQIERYIEANTQIINLNSNIGSEAGKIKAQERQEKPQFGLMDALILATAKQNNLVLLTGDPHLTDKEIADDIS